MFFHKNLDYPMKLKQNLFKLEPHMAGKCNGRKFLLGSQENFAVNFIARYISNFQDLNRAIAHFYNITSHLSNYLDSF